MARCCALLADPAAKAEQRSREALHWPATATRPFERARTELRAGGEPSASAPPTAGRWRCPASPRPWERLVISQMRAITPSPQTVAESSGSAGLRGQPAG